MHIDLHIHTVASDGAWTAAQVVEGAVAGRLDAIAIADHDTTAAVGPAQQAAVGKNLQVIPAAELSSTLGDRELHILGYFIDLQSSQLHAYQERAQHRRRQRMEGMVERLRSAGITVEMAGVLQAAGPQRFMLARPHLARALVEAGYASSVNEAFDRHIGDDRPAFIPTRLQEPAEAVSVILAGGGVPVWAHPPLDLVEGLLPGLVEEGLRGLEVYRPSSSPGHIRRLLALARGRSLLVSGGSDWHDPERNEPLGSFYVTGDEVAGLLGEGGM